jgi:hypothetical protein
MQVRDSTEDSSSGLAGDVYPMSYEDTRKAPETARFLALSIFGSSLQENRLDAWPLRSARRKSLLCIVSHLQILANVRPQGPKDGRRVSSLNPSHKSRCDLNVAEAFTFRTAIDSPLFEGMATEISSASQKRPDPAPAGSCSARTPAPPTRSTSTIVPCRRPGSPASELAG